MRIWTVRIIYAGIALVVGGFAVLGGWDLYLIATHRLGGNSVSGVLLDYSRQHSGELALIMFAVGFGLGTLFGHLFLPQR